MELKLLCFSMSASETRRNKKNGHRYWVGEVSKALNGTVSSVPWPRKLCPSYQAHHLVRFKLHPCPLLPVCPPQPHGFIFTLSIITEDLDSVTEELPLGTHRTLLVNLSWSPSTTRQDQTCGRDRDDKDTPSSHREAPRQLLCFGPWQELWLLCGFRQTSKCLWTPSWHKMAQLLSFCHWGKVSNMKNLKILLAQVSGQSIQL